MRQRTLSLCLSALLLAGALPLSAQSRQADEQTLRKIFDESLVNGEAYENLRHLCKEIGGRLSGSKQAEEAVAWGKALMESYGFDSVWLQPVMVPKWERGLEREYARIIHSDGRVREIAISALGFSVATPAGGLRAKVIEVQSLEQVSAMPKDAMKDKIVFYNRPMEPRLINTFHAYGGCVDQRSGGASEGAAKGAVGSLVRSMNLRLDDIPHTGVQNYTEGVAKVPAAAVSTLGADYLSKALKEDPNLEIEMVMSCKRYADVLSHNVIGEIRGTEHRDEVILVSGHLDSWDTGEGAHDDGAGVVHSIEALRLLQSQGIRPKRTWRCVLWMNEENGAKGALKYAEENKKNGLFHLAAIESDRGGFTPRGFTIDGIDGIKERAMSSMANWTSLLKPYDLHKFEYGYSGVDVNKMKDQGFVLIGFVPDSQRYFDHHHTHIDVFEAVNKRELELGAASIAGLVYLIDKYGFQEVVPVRN